MTAYQRPAIARALDHNEVNRIWKLAAAATGVRTEDVLAACRAAGMDVTKNRVKAWSYADDNPSFSAMNVTELEQVLAAIIDWKRSATSQTHDTGETRDE